MVVAIRDVITFAKFGSEIFRGYDFAGSRIFGFPIDSCMGLAWRYCTACDIVHPFSRVWTRNVGFPGKLEQFWQDVFSVATND